MVAPAPIFSEMLQTAFSQIRHYAAGDTDTLIRLLHAYHAIGQVVSRPKEKEALWRQVLYLMETADVSVETDGDRARLNRAYSSIAATFGEGADGAPLESVWSSDDVVY